MAFRVTSSGGRDVAKTTGSLDAGSKLTDTYCTFECHRRLYFNDTPLIARHSRTLSSDAHVAWVVLKNGLRRLLRTMLDWIKLFVVPRALDEVTPHDPAQCDGKLRASPI